ncbi:MAG: DUF3089 domain-containing protein [Halioglobus sp.]|nr:DUF3089 domain-containing protein [Halioglobus sp.]
MTRAFILTPLAFVLAITLAGCPGDNDSNGPENPFRGFSSEIYSNTGNWLCHPDLATEEDVCERDLRATAVFAAGNTEIEEHARADQGVDCFYVYPTVSGDEGGIADLNEGVEEIFTTLNQAARYSRFCRMFAPVYRQFTVNAIFTDVEVDPEIPYGDVLASFKHYIANHNNGRGFILIGHSQGAGHLRRLVAETVESEPYLLERLVSAHLLGSSVHVPPGADVGGDFQAVPVCRTLDQTGCVVSFATYRDSDPFLADGEGRFGNPDSDGNIAVCVNPAAPAGGSAELDAYFPLTSIPALEAVIISRANGPFADPDNAPPLTTPFFKMPGFLRGECKINSDNVSYLEVTALADPNDPRADDFNGEFVVGPGWGLHLVDVTVTMGDLVAMGRAQGESWLSDR